MSHSNSNPEILCSLWPRDEKFGNLQFPDFSKPQQVSSYSLVGQRQVEINSSNRNYLRADINELYMKNAVDFDLNIGYEQCAPSTSSVGPLDELFDWYKLMKQQKQSDEVETDDSQVDAKRKKSTKEFLFNTDVLCFRGLLTRIAHTPYEQRDGWHFLASMHEGVIFLCEIETEQKRAQNANMDERGKLFSFYGYKFEQYMLVKHEKDSSPCLEEAVNPNEQFCVLFRSKLNGLRLLYAAEVDAFDPQSNTYIELKTNRINTHWKQTENFHRHKSCKWWLQSFLAGITQLIVGERTDNGIVKHLNHIKTTELAAQAKNHWSGSVCMNFLSTVLCRVRQILIDQTNNNQSVTIDQLNEAFVDKYVLSVEYIPGQSVIMKSVLTKNNAFLSNKYFE